MKSPDPAATQRSIALLHAILTGTLAVIGIAFVLVVQFRGALLPRGGPSGLIGLLTAAVGLTCVAIAIVIFRPRLPEPTRGSAGPEYWTPESRRNALLLWVLCENGGMIAAVGFLLTGALTSLAALAIAALSLTRLSPRRLTSG